MTAGGLIAGFVIAVGAGVIARVTVWTNQRLHLDAVAANVLHEIGKNRESRNRLEFLLRGRGVHREQQDRGR